MLSSVTIVLAGAVGTAVKSVVVPVVVAALTAAATLLLTRASEAANRRRDRYAGAVETLVAWIEFPYRVRRRTSDDPATLAELAARGHDLQERMACHQTWIATEYPALADQYDHTRATVTSAVAPAVAEAWTLKPISAAHDMNLGDWGPAAACGDAMAALQHAIENRFGVRRVAAWLRR